MSNGFLICRKNAKEGGLAVTGYALALGECSGFVKSGGSFMSVSIATTDLWSLAHIRYKFSIGLKQWYLSLLKDLLVEETIGFAFNTTIEHFC